MRNIDWSFVQLASQLLERDEREVVLGDLLEASETAWRGLFDVLGLVMRRQAGLWKNWRPWIAAVGLAVPSSFLLRSVPVLSFTIPDRVALQLLPASLSSASALWSSRISAKQWHKTGSGNRSSGSNNNADVLKLERKHCMAS